ncbi:MAG TPA: competence/damage-inducible protein A [Acidimicrobiia bacterium]|nr:competence/damage-inducible protein A [Acidimicrobiia bacterium]
MNVEVLAVGTELLLGQIINTNGAHIGARLAEFGIDHYRQAVVGDNLERLTDAIGEAAVRADALIVTGGLGPTQDDLTREALCAAAGVEMRRSEEQEDALRDLWARRGRQMPASNLRQAQYPDGAEMLSNRKGTAPGLRMRIGSCLVFALPGVPEEMETMLDEFVLPTLVGENQGERGVIVSRLLRTWGESESRIAELLADIYSGSTNPTLAFLASGGEIKLRLTARAADAAAADAAIEPMEAEIRGRLGALVFGADDQTIETIVLDACRRRGWRMATAESMTSGLVAVALTMVPGASEVFAGAIVAYTASVKETALGVPASLIAEHGQVSAEVALAMADGAVDRLGVEVAVAVTGAAGPDPLDREPGTVVIAVRTPEATRTRELVLPGDRERVRTYATTAALHQVRLALTQGDA